MQLDLDFHEHFSFDLWRTLIKSDPHFKLKRDELFKDYFLIEKDIDEVKKVVRHYDILFNNISEITGKHIEREEIFLIILDALGKEVNTIDEENLHQFFEKLDHLFLNNMPVLIWDDIEGILMKIKEKHKTASVLSNTAFIQGESLRKVLDELRLSNYFSFMIFSDEVKVSKPHSRIFDLMYHLANDTRKIEKRKILHIGDNKIADYDGAKRYGVDAKLVKF